MSLEETLRGGLAALHLDVAHDTRHTLAAYLRLVEKWNQVYNLTAVRDIGAMLTHHVLDSLAVAPHFDASTVLDVGSGAGLPGIPLAIAKPEGSFTLLDSNHKKATFLRQAIIELGLRNVTVVCERVERWRTEARFDAVISRAFSDLSQFLALAGRLCSPNGVLIAMKGVYPDEELAHLTPGYRLLDVRRVQVPGLAADRHLIFLQPESLSATHSA